MPTTTNNDLNMSNTTTNKQLLREARNAFSCRGIGLSGHGYHSLRGSTDGYEVVVGPNQDNPRLVFMMVYNLGDLDARREPVTTVNHVDCWVAAQTAWLLGVAYRAGSRAQKGL